MKYLSELIKKAEQGDSNAMIDLGVMYRWGNGVARDMEKCFYWTNKATALLNPIAYQYLGYHHEIPVGYSDPNDDDADYKTVFDCFFKGAILDDLTSIYKVGDMYFTGKFVEKDQRFAFELYKRSEKIFGYSSASLNLRLGECYCMGLGTEQDIEKAHEYLENAIAEYEDREADGEVPELFMEGYNRAKHLLKRIDADKIPGKPIDLEMEKKNMEYTAFVAGEQKNFPEPHYPIEALEALKKENPELTIPKGEDFNTALTKVGYGDTRAMYYIAFYCINRFENEPDRKDMIDFALHYYYQSARSGFSAALYSLGTVYRRGQAVTPDPKKALLYYDQSKETIAQEEIGRYYLNGEFVEQDYERAFKCFVKCALFREKYDYAALPELARMYREGLFVDPDTIFADYLEEEGKKRGESVREYEKG